MATNDYNTDQKTIQDITNHYKNGHLNLTPGFQRDSVWRDRDRMKLIDSVLRNYPLPSIFLYRREEKGNIVYDVIDGKQRIESILMFIGVIRGNRFSSWSQLPGREHAEWVDWGTLRKRQLQHKVTGYKLQAIEVEGDPADIIDLFVRINSTGKALTGAEKRHARYYNSDFLRKAGQLARRYEKYFLSNRILNRSQVSRMKHVELVCELMVSGHSHSAISPRCFNRLFRYRESASTIWYQHRYQTWFFWKRLLIQREPKFIVRVGLPVEELATGLEPATRCLQGSRSTI